MRRITILTVLFVLCIHTYGQNFAVKTNTLYWLAGGNANIGLEQSAGNKVTLQLSATYNPWKFDNSKYMRFWLVEPELKYWLCSKYEGHFFGIYAHGADFYGVLKQKIYDGYMVGGSLSWGYNWILSPHWNLETEIGVGYEYLWYDRYPELPCLKCRESHTKHYVGPTKAALSLVYIF